MPFNFGIDFEKTVQLLMDRVHILQLRLQNLTENSTSSACIDRDYDNYNTFNVSAK